jgi:DNA-binding LacI/PurR family transcriptional regulator
MISIKDVAIKANVSTATVSRVINGNYTVTPETKERVLNVIKELNYYPNSVARSLKNDTTHTIGFLVSDIANDYFVNVARAIEDVASKSGYNIIVCSTEDKKERELSYLKMFLSKKVDGIILNTTGHNNEFVAEISNLVPTVLIERKIEDEYFKGDYVTNDNVTGAYSLTSHMLSLGHRKIAVVNGNMSLNNARERYLGFKNAMAEYGLDTKDYKYRYDGDFSMESGYRAAEKLLNAEDRPTAVVAMNNMTGVGVLKYIHNKGIKIPDDLLLTVFGEIQNLDILFAKPAFVRLQPKLVGNKVIELLLSRIKNKNVKSREVLFMPQFIV